MSSHDKLKALQNWQNGEVDVMVSTSAFGTGVDRKDVDVVVNVGVLQSLEDLVQMFGRARRDGRNACGMLVTLPLAIVVIIIPIHLCSI